MGGPGASPGAGTTEGLVHWQVRSARTGVGSERGLGGPNPPPSSIKKTCPGAMPGHGRGKRLSAEEFYHMETKAVSVPPRLESGGSRKGARVQVTPSPPKFIEALGIWKAPFAGNEESTYRWLAGSNPVASAMEGSRISVGRACLLNTSPSDGRRVRLSHLPP